MNNFDERMTSLVKEFCSHLKEDVSEFQELSQAQKDLDADAHSKKLWEDTASQGGGGCCG